MRSKCCQAAICAGNTSCTPRRGSILLLKKSLRSAGGTRVARLHSGRNDDVRIAPEDSVGAGFEAGHVARHELRTYRDRPIVDLELNAARKPQVDAHGRRTRDGPHAVGAATACEGTSA